MNCPTEFRIFKGRKVSKLPSNSDVCYVLLSCNCTLYQKVNTCKKKGCKCDEFTWKQVCIKEPFVFIDVCKEMVTLVNIQSTPCQIKAPCKSSCGSPCGSCTSCTSCSSGTVTTTSSTTSELGSASSLTCPLDSDPLVTFCTITVDSSNTLRSTTTSATCPTGATTPTITITNLAEWSVCSGSDVDLTGSILGSATNFLIVTPPGPNATFNSLSGNPDQLTVQDVFDQTVNPDGIPVLLFDLVGGSFRAGVFSADDLETIPFTILTPEGDTLFAPTAAFGTNNQATQPNALAMGWNAWAYLPGSMAHSSCNTTAITRPFPPLQPANATLGACQYLRVLMSGQTACVSGSDLCDATGGSCLSSSDETCGTQDCTTTRYEIDCSGDAPVCVQFPGIPDCVPGGNASTFCGSSGEDENYAVTTFYLCDPTVDVTVDPTFAWLYLPYTGTAYGEIEIVAPRVVGCNAGPLLCPFAQKWCFVVSQIQSDTETTHIIDKIEPMCGNNSLTGLPADERYTLCGIVSGCPDNGLVRWTFELIRNDPIGTFPGDAVAPNFCATVTMTMVASGICTPLDCGLEVTPRECFLCCPIPVDVRGDEDCLPRCTDCTGRVDLTCNTSSSSSSSTTTTTTTARKATRSARGNARGSASIQRRGTTSAQTTQARSIAAAQSRGKTSFTGPRTVNQQTTTPRSVPAPSSVQAPRSAQVGRPSQAAPRAAKRACGSCGGSAARVRATTQGRQTKGGADVVSSAQTPAATE